MDPLLSYFAKESQVRHTYSLRGSASDRLRTAKNNLSIYGLIITSLVPTLVSPPPTR